jgi:4-amino-4-deoxy-L-arabinose transferase-like glycosyltransferase
LSPTPAERHARLGTALGAALMAASLLLAFLAARGQDPTNDERLYFGVGRSLIMTGRWQGLAALLHPPLAYYVSALPLLGPGAESQPSCWNPLLLLSCRTTSLLVFGTPLLIAVFRWARERDGLHAGVVALTLTGFSPTLLAHAGLITPDLPLTATGFVALYLFWRSARKRGSALAWGVALGLALLAKGSAWLFVAAILALASLRRGAEPMSARGVAMALAVMVLVVNLGYGFSGSLDLEGKRLLLARVPDRFAFRALALLATPLFPLPYLKAMATQLHTGVQGWPSFFLGEVSRTGWAHYFVVALALKETLPFLVLLAFSLLFGWRRREVFDDLCLVLPALLFFAAFSMGRVQMGIRYVLPALPLLAVFMSGVARSGRPALKAAAIILIAWHAVASVRACPSYIAYFNELAGGPGNGYKYLGDSNLDWGQNRSQALAFAHRNGFVFEPAVLPASGVVVVSASRLQGIPDRDTYRVLRERYDPVGNVGYAYLVYDLGRERRQAETP